MLDLIVPLQFLFQVLLIGAVFWWLPRWSRPELFFAVTVPAELRESEPGRRILATFRRHVLIAALSAATAVLALLLASPERLWLGVGVLLVESLWLLAAFLLARRATLPYAVPPTLVRTTGSPEAPPARLPGGLFGQLLPFLVLAAVALYLVGRWESLPETFAVHWDASFEADGWARKTPLMVFWPLIFGAVTCLGMAATSFVILRRSRGAATAEAGRAEAQRRASVAYVLWACEIFLALVFALTGFLPLAQTSSQAKQLALAIVLLSVLGSLVLVIWSVVKLGRIYDVSGRSGESASDGGPLGDSTPDSCWKLGLVYYNPDDPAFLVEKRVGIGYTFNFARPAAWIFLGAVVLVPVALALLIVFGV